MTTPLQTQIWRTVAFFLVVGASGLGAYYAFIQRPIEQHNQKFVEEIAEMRRQLDTPIEPEEARSLPAAELDPACARYRELVVQLDATDANTQRFAIEEITRRAGLKHLNLAAPQTVARHGANDHVQRLELAGEPKAIQRVLHTLIASERVGVPTFELQTQKPDADDDRRAKRATPLLEGAIELHAYVPNDAQRTFTELCSATAP